MRFYGLSIVYVFVCLFFLFQAELMKKGVSWPLVIVYLFVCLFISG